MKIYLSGPITGDPDYAEKFTVTGNVVKAALPDEETAIMNPDVSDYINRELILAEYDRQHKGPPGGARKIMETYPAADVVARDCYDRVLAENDAMREQLAKIGKKPGDSMEGVTRQLHGHWLEEDNGCRQICSECGEEHEWSPGGFRASYCDACGAKMEGQI